MAEASETVLKSPSPFQVRAELEELVYQDLLGPAGGDEEEVDEDRVRERYLVGLLAPRQQSVAPEEIDDLAVDGAGAGEDGATDIGALQVGTILPSSLGMSFCATGDAEAIRVRVRWGRYKRKHSKTRTDSKTGNPVLVWKRMPVEGVVEALPLQEGPISPRPVVDEQPDVVIQGQISRLDSDWIVSLFLVNGQEQPNRRADEAWLFQPELLVEAPDRWPIFRRRLAR